MKAPVYIPNEGVPIDFTQYEFTDIDSEGLVAIGANFHPVSLLTAYHSGLFPWFIEDGMPYWFCPDPRMVLFPSQLKITASMRNVFNKKTFSFTCDKAFEKVIQACAQTKRKIDQTTWIDEDFIGAYTTLHQLGFAHSFETWIGNELVGGLYGVAIGKVFFGESMFSVKPNASKAAFIQGVRFLSLHDFKMIDCQVATDHLSSLGAIAIQRSDFIEAMKKMIVQHEMNGEKWEERFYKMYNESR